ncbi:MAG TPA: ABC transporter permease subunit [Solirubrobacter sp.]|nr:ABC transporter permease subunit [Solirubrobacter sp.]
MSSPEINVSEPAPRLGTTASPEAAARSDGSFWRNKWTLRVISWLILLAIWQIVAIWRGPFFVPTLQAVVFDGLPEVFSAGYSEIFLNSWAQLFLGFFVACAIAIPLGALMGRFRAVNAFLSPYANSLFVTPSAALLPLIILLAGTDLQYRVVVVVLFAFFYPLVGTAAGVRYVEGTYTETGRAFCLSRLQFTTKILLPASAPFIVEGVRLGLGMAVQGMLVAELWVSGGTGQLLSGLSERRELDTYFALAALVVALSLVLMHLLRRLEDRLPGSTRLEL